MLMRVLAALYAAGMLGAGMFGVPAQAASEIPYRWCAEMGDHEGNMTNCYFATLQQCQWAVSGNGGFCRENAFYRPGPERGPGRRPGRDRR
ncbi:MAG: DUF3551 domain-containing protein [Proteobacteria bacterium]|nr:DUF3551 domain-containing protein [Pseudomonadota bacterium]